MNAKTPHTRAAPAETQVPAPASGMAGGQGVVLGIGCDRNTPYATLAQAIDEALARLRASWGDVRAVASIDLKADEVAMQELQVAGEVAQALTHAATDDAPAAAGVPQHRTPPGASVPVSPRSVSLPEPAPMSALLIEKHKLRGPDGRNATVSVARAGGMPQTLPETGHPA